MLEIGEDLTKEYFPLKSHFSVCFLTQGRRVDWLLSVPLSGEHFGFVSHKGSIEYFCFLFLIGTTSEANVK